MIRALHIGAAAPGAFGQVDREINAEGMLLMPGLVNGHFHSSVNHLKGALDSLPLELFMLYESPAEAAEVTPRMVYVRTMLAAMEMLRSGTTAVLDDAFFVPGSDARYHRCRDASVRRQRHSGRARAGSAQCPGTQQVPVSWPTSCRRTCGRLLPRHQRWMPPGCSGATSI